MPGQLRMIFGGAREECRRFLCQYARLIDSNHFDRGPAAPGADAAGVVGAVGLLVDADAGPVEAAHDAAADRGAVFADAATEGDDVDSAELAHEGPQVVPRPPAE